MSCREWESAEAWRRSDLFHPLDFYIARVLNVSVDLRSMLREVQKILMKRPRQLLSKAGTAELGNFFPIVFLPHHHPSAYMSEMKTLIYRGPVRVSYHPLQIHTQVKPYLAWFQWWSGGRIEGVCVHTDDVCFQLTYSGNILYSIARDGGSTVNTSSDFFNFPILAVSFDRFLCSWIVLSAFLVEFVRAAITGKKGCPENSEFSVNSTAIPRYHRPWIIYLWWLIPCACN